MAPHVFDPVDCAPPEEIACLEVDRAERQRGGVEGVDPLVRRTASVRGSAEEADVLGEQTVAAAGE